MLRRVSLFVLSLAVFCTIQLKLHVCEDALTRKLEVIRRPGVNLAAVNDPVRTRVIGCTTTSLIVCSERDERNASHSSVKLGRTTYAEESHLTRGSLTR